MPWKAEAWGPCVVGNMWWRGGKGGGRKNEYMYIYIIPYLSIDETLSMQNESCASQFTSITRKEDRYTGYTMLVPGYLHWQVGTQADREGHVLRGTARF